MKDKPDEKMREYRVELGQRTSTISLRDDPSREKAGDSEEVRKIVDDISRLVVKEGNIEEAENRLTHALKKNPEALGLRALELALSMISGRPLGDYKRSCELAANMMELAVQKNNSYYSQAVLTNLGIISQREGLEEYSKVLYLAAFMIDRTTLTPIQNIVSYYARRDQFQQAQSFIDILIQVCPSWEDREDVIEWLVKDSSLSNLRESGYQPFVDRVWKKVQARQDKT